MIYKILALTLSITLAGCGGQTAFHEYARAGDTVAVPVGMQPTFNKNNITVTITPSVGNPIYLQANDPSIRAIINFYPDPISSMVISREISEDMTPFAQTYADTVLYSSNYDKDYYQTTIFLDLPQYLPTGATQINISEPSGASHSVSLDIIEGTGTSNSFTGDIAGEGQISFDKNMLDSLSRSPHVEVTFEATSLPHAIEVNFTHDPDKTAGGTGKAFIVNPLGYKKNLFWQDDGINLKIIIMQSKPGLINNIKDFNFYVAGTATNLQLQNVSSFDLNGNPISGTNVLLTAY